MVDPHAALAMRIARRMVGAGELPKITLVHADRNIVFRVDADRKYAIKLFVADEDGLKRELVARELLADVVPFCAVVARHADDRNDPPVLVMDWSAGRALSTLMSMANSVAVDSAFENAAFVAARIGALDRTIVARARRRLPEGAVLAHRAGSRNVLDAFDRAAIVLVSRLGDDIVRRLRAVFLNAARAIWDDEAVVSHGDFKPNNLLFDDSGQVEAILDWELAAIDSPWSDLSHLLRHAETDEHEERIAIGYSRCRSLPVSWRCSARIYDLVRVAIGLSQPTLEGDDVREWIDYLAACLGAVETGEVAHVRSAAKPLLRALGTMGNPGLRR